ncbi:MAG: IclR family transcriptional regulator [Alphaproteobacteria bacterium]|nr:IclR family transcriptional regulator [Alphaproteobacteria bacterium]
MAKTQTYKSQSLERGIAILDCLGDSAEPLTLTELCRRTHLDTGTAYRYLAVLTRHRYVLKDPVTRRYSLSYGLFRLGHRPYALATLARHAQRFIVELADLTGLDASVGTLEGRQVVIIETVRPGKGPVDADPEYSDAHASAVGKVLLAHRGDAHVDRLYRDVPLRRITDTTIVSLQRLQGEMRRTMEAGYAVERGERRPNLHAVAGAVVNPGGEANIAIALSGPANRLSGANEARHGARVRDVAREFAAYIVDIS